MVNKVFVSSFEKRSNKYISEKEAMDVLGLTRNTFIEFQKNYGLEIYLSTGNRRFYERKEIDFYKEQQDQIGERYITTSMVMSRYKERCPKIEYFLYKKANKIKIPLFCRNVHIVDVKEFIYDSEEIEEYVQEYELKYYLETNNKTDTDKFLSLIDLKIRQKKLQCIDNSNYTKKAWINYACRKLNDNSKKIDRSSRDLKLSRLMNATIELDNLLKISGVSEVYMLATNQINLWFSKISNGNTRSYIYYFFEIVSLDIERKINEDKKYVKSFCFKEIIRYDDPIFKNNVKSVSDKEIIYDKDTYYSVITHLIDIPLHIERAINNLCKKNDPTYLSVWIYCMLHVCNIANNKAILLFPRVYITDIIDRLNIKDISWFAENTVSKETINNIISRFFPDSSNHTILKEIQYYCSNTLAPAMTTALLLLEFYWQNCNDKRPEFNEPVLIFKGSKYNTPTVTMLKKCFEGFRIPDFKFTSKKMNNTVLKMFSDTIKKNPSGYNSFIPTKKIDLYKSANYYEQLSHDLFLRGELGYIANSLLNSMVGSPKNNTKRTLDINNINSLFGSSLKIELTNRMINYFDDKKTDSLIYKSSLNDSIKLATEVYMDDLPNTFSRMQCQSIEQEKNCSKADCLGCRHSIPCIYVMRLICNSLMEDISEYRNATTPFTELKLLLRIHSKKEKFIDIISMFGKEYAYIILGVNRKDFIKQLDKIPDTYNLSRLSYYEDNLFY